MSGPYDAVRAAVAGYAATAASVSATSPGSAGSSPTGTFAGTEPAVGVYSVKLGALVATYPSESYDRLLEALMVECTEVCPVSVFYGAAQPATRITSYGDGSLSDFSPPIPRFVPANAALLVVWYSTSAAQGTANAQLRSAA